MRTINLIVEHLRHHEQENVCFRRNGAYSKYKKIMHFGPGEH